MVEWPYGLRMAFVSAAALGNVGSSIGLGISCSAPSTQPSGCSWTSLQGYISYPRVPRHTILTVRGREECDRGSLRMNRAKGARDGIGVV